MTYPLSRIMSTATAAYGVYALLQPGHLGAALDAPDEQRPAFDVMAQTYALRDIPVSAVGMFASSPALVSASMLMRIASDIGDATILGSSVRDEQVREKVLQVTLGWAALNAVALWVDRRRERRRVRRIA